jgi:hypothetical protein
MVYLPAKRTKSTKTNCAWEGFEHKSDLEGPVIVAPDVIAPECEVDSKNDGGTSPDYVTTTNKSTQTRFRFTDLDTLKEQIRNFKEENTNLKNELKTTSKISEKRQNPMNVFQ